MKVGEVATRAGISVRSVRYYEQAGLIVATRQTNGYREFDETAIALARSIRDLIASGLTIDEVRSLSSCLPATTTMPDCCTQTAALYRHKLEQIDSQLTTLGAIRRRIEERLASLAPLRGSSSSTLRCSTGRFVSGGPTPTTPPGPPTDTDDD